MAKKFRLVLLSPKGPLYRHGGGIFKKSLRYAPRTLPFLAALVPPELEVQIRIIDEGIELIPEEIEADLIAMTTITGSSKRVYELADKFRARNIPVVLGGPHVTLVPEDAAPHADAIVVGYAEQTWPELLRDFAEGKMRARYDQPPGHKLIGLPDPRMDLIKPQHYMTTHVFEATRGCIHTCDFCVVPFAWGSKPYQRPVPEVVAEIQRRKSRKLIFVDLNIIADRTYALELFAALIPLKLEWFGLATSLLARDPELLDLAARSGCRGLLVGFESLTPESLKDTRKNFNAVSVKGAPLLDSVTDIEGYYTDVVKRFHEKGISVQGCFAFGADHDTRESILKTAQFAIDAKIDLPRYSIMTPFPGTDFYRRMEKEGRLLHRNWELYDAQHVVFQPLNMTPAELLDAHEQAWRKTYSLSGIARRIAGSRVQIPISIMANLGYRFYAYHLHSHYNCDWIIGDAKDPVPQPAETSEQQAV